MTPEKEKLHGQVVGGFLITFGHLEAVACHWIYLLTKDQKARDEAIDLRLNQRIKRVCDLIPASHFSPDQKKRAVELWDEVIELSKIRNKIAHSPLITNRDDQTGFIDLRELKGVLDGHPVPIAPLTFFDIATAGKRLLAVLNELIKIIA